MGGFADKTIRATYYITENSLWRLKEFLDHCGIAGIRPPVEDVVAYRAVQERRVLGDQADLAAHRVRFVGDPATLVRMGIESRFVNGLRVTDRETRDVAVMVFGGLLNKRLAGAISLAGQPAVGISASDAACFLAEPMQIDENERRLGFVGYLTGVNLDFLRAQWRAGVVPVASCLGLGADGEIYNINADHMAAAAAEFIRADRLIFLTDVAGVLDGDKVLRALRGGEIEDMIRRNKVSGGMILKLEAAKRALSAGVTEVRIVGGTASRALLNAANAVRCSGTRVLPVLKASAAKAAQGTAR